MYEINVHTRRMKYLRLVPMLCVMGALFFLSHQPGGTFPAPLFAGQDKVSHLAAYFVLSVTVIAAFSWPSDSRSRLRSAFYIVAICVLFGASDELHQSFIPGRSPSGWDLLADTIGALVAAVLWLVWLGRAERRDRVAG